MRSMHTGIYIKTGKKEFDEFYPRIKGFLEQDYLDMVIDGKEIRGYRAPDGKSVWIRDHSEMMRGFKYFEKDLKSAVEHFAETQANNGRIFDFFTIFPEKLPSEKENWAKYVRVPVEADVEYRFVKAAFLAWQATGDDDWIKKLLPKLEKALNYTLTNQWRWDEKTKLVKRAYTIDTWDFAYTAGKHDWLQFQIDDDTFWGIMHGDNSGYYQAFRIMVLLNEYLGDSDRAKYWQEHADSIRGQMNAICWNGRFYTHFVKLTPVGIEGLNEFEQLSLSNPADINRGVATHEMAVSIIREYLARRSATTAFAEWFSIDPPFPDGVFGDEKLVGGAYVNGGILPFVGGELAKAAFDHGYEEYGIDILKRYYDMVAETGETYLWYFPDGTPSTIDTSTSPLATPTDGWGSSAMLYGFIEGLAGVEDKLKLFQRARLSPRWPAADVREAEVRVCYDVSGAAIGYLYRIEKNRILLEVDAPKSVVDFHVLLPKHSKAVEVTTDGVSVDFEQVNVGQSPYVDFTVEIENCVKVELVLEQGNR